MFFSIGLRQTKVWSIIGNPEVKWDTPENLGGYDELIQAKDSSFDRSKGEKKHARKVIKYEKFLDIEESIQMLLIQAVDKPFLKALKDDYIGYDRKTPNNMIEQLQTKISKVTNKDKVQLKKEVFIKWEQLQTGQKS